MATGKGMALTRRCRRLKNNCKRVWSDGHALFLLEQLFSFASSNQNDSSTLKGEIR
jgi:hypothetical protein